MDTIGGYRLVRLLGLGARAEVYLGHAGTDASRPSRVAAVKLYRSGVERLSVDTELDALGRLDSPHLLQLLDVATDRSGMPAAILRRLGSENLAQVLIGRAGLAAGEAVTILAPLVQAVAELHRVGVLHGAVRLSNVLFDAAGAPVLAGFGAVSVIGANPVQGEHSLTVAELSGDSGARAELRALALLCRRVLDRTRQVGSRSDELSDFLDGFLEGAAGGADLDARAFPDQLADRLFWLADPLPVNLTPARDPSSGHSPGPQRAIGPRTNARDSGGTAGRSVGRRHHSRHRRGPDAAEPAVVAGVRTGSLCRGGGRYPTWLLRFRFRRVRIRRRFWVAGAVGVLALVGALALIPAQAPSGAVLRPGPSASDSPKTTSAPPPSTRPPSTPSPSTGAMIGDDPVEATRQLLQARARCLSGHVAGCLNTVDQADSAAMDNDTRAIASGETAASSAQADGKPSREDLLFPIADATLSERLGDGALVSVTLPGSGTTPVSVLVIRTGAGWRIRDVLIG